MGITVIVREDKTVTTDAKTEGDREWNLDATLSKWFRLDPNNNLLAQHFAWLQNPVVVARDAVFGR